MAKVALVTGASGGIGRTVAQELKSEGFKVYAAARRVDRMADLENDGITPVALDLTKDESIVECVNTILSKEKSIDILVNNARVRSALMELLPGGECTIDDVAKKLGYSKRSLQRKLQEEDTNFQKQLSHTRELLAKTYLANTDMTTEDIAFLLGYQEIGSFIRAFAVWTGQTVNEYKKVFLANKIQAYSVKITY